ncbi:hypothetical protein [Enterococcus larvae]|uniref:hypothetical protein n=1 Tax=Enterococcus larvae TaxID=2794352 RepID=UPI003F3745EF
MDKEEIQAQPTREEVKQEMLDHLQEKYGEEFECQSIEYKSWSQSGYEHMFAYPKDGNPKNNFAIYRYDEGERYEDGYVGFVMEKVYQEKIEAIVKEYFPTSVVRSGFAKRYTYPDSFDLNMDFEVFERYVDKKNRVVASIYIAAQKKEEVSNEVLASVEKKMKGMVAIGSLSVVGFMPEEFEEYIINDPFNSIEEHTSFSNTGEMFSIDRSWGEIDFDYEYKEGE